MGTGEKESNMRNKFILGVALSSLALAGIANAQAGTAGSGTLGVTATVVGSINLTFITDAAGMAVTGTGTNTASLPFGNVSLFSPTVPAGVTKTVTGMTSFTLSTPFDVRADITNSTSATYLLSVSVSTIAAALTYVMGATDISSGAAFTIAAAAAYATPLPYTLHLTIPASQAAGLMSNTINFTATSN